MTERLGFVAIDAIIASLGLLLAAGLVAVETLRRGRGDDRLAGGMWDGDGRGRFGQAIVASVPILLGLLIAAWLAADAAPASPLLSGLAAMVVAGAFLSLMVFVGPLGPIDPAYVAGFSLNIAVLGIVVWIAPSPIVVSALLPLAIVAPVFALGWRVGVPLAALALASCLAAILWGRSAVPDEVVRTLAYTSAAGIAFALAIVASLELGRKSQGHLIDRLSLDVVTAMHTRAQMELVLRQELTRARRFGRPLSILMIDLDQMKAVNDSLGHQAGDRFLRSVGQAIERSTRRSDFAARFGGDEFVVLLPETGREGAAVIAGVVQRRVAAVRVGSGSRVLSGSASVGSATYPENGTTEAQLLSYADWRMYAEKLRRQRPR